MCGISMTSRSNDPLSRAWCPDFRRSGFCDRGCVRAKNGRVHIMCHLWVRNQCRYQVTDGACPKGHHWHYPREDNTSSDKDHLLVAMQEGCRRLRKEHALRSLPCKRVLLSLAGNHLEDTRVLLRLIPARFGRIANSTHGVSWPAIDRNLGCSQGRTDGYGAADTYKHKSEHSLERSTGSIRGSSPNVEFYDASTGCYDLAENFALTARGLLRREKQTLSWRMAPGTSS